MAYFEAVNFTISDAKEANPTFFSKTSMRFWRSRVETSMMCGRKYGFFVTSERFQQDPRKYMIRAFDGEEIFTLRNMDLTYSRWEVSFLEDARKICRALADDRWKVKSVDGYLALIDPTEV